MINLKQERNSWRIAGPARGWHNGSNPAATYANIRMTRITSVWRQAAELRKGTRNLEKELHHTHRIPYTRARERERDAGRTAVSLLSWDHSPLGSSISLSATASARLASAPVKSRGTARRQTRHETGAADLPPMHPARKSIAEVDGLKTHSRFPEVLKVDSVFRGGGYKYTDALIDMPIASYWRLATI